MSGLKDRFPEFAFGGYKVSPDEMDRYDVYGIHNPSTSATWFGTAEAGTSTQAKTLVITNILADYPRNLAGGVAGSAAMGGTFVVNGISQFGETIQETITIGTAANGGTTAGTLVFAEVTSGTFTFTSGAVGNGTPTLGVSTVGTSVIFGLPAKIASTSDVKSITWINGTVATALNGGTISSYVNTSVHGFRGTANVTASDRFQVWYKPTYDNSGKDNMAKW